MNFLSNKRNLAIIITNFIFLSISFALLIYMMVSHKAHYPIFMISLEAVLVVFYLYLNISYVLKLKVFEQLHTSLEQETLHNQVLQSLYDNVRTFRHDFFNIMQSIDGYIKTGDIHALTNYYHEISIECSNMNSLSVLDPSLIDEPAIYNLIVSKFNKAEAMGISFDINFLVKFSSLPAKPYIISRILGILLDNAIEAASSSVAKKVIFEIIPITGFDPARQITHIIIENSYANKDVDIDRICEKGFTSKSEDGLSHGLGLWKVKELLQKQDNLTLHTSKTDTFFRQVLEIH